MLTTAIQLIIVDYAAYVIEISLDLQKHPFSCSADVQ